MGFGTSIMWVALSGLGTLVIGIPTIYLIKRKNYQPHNFKEKVEKLCLLNKPKINKFLYLSGENAFERRKIGKIVGIYKDNGETLHKKREELDAEKGICLTEEQKEEVEEKIKQIDERISKLRTFIAFRDTRLDPTSILAIYDGDTSSLDKSLVYVNSMTLTAPYDGILYLPKHFKKESKDLEAKKPYAYTLEEAQSDIIRLSQGAIEASPFHQKSIEKSNMFADKGEGVQGEAIPNDTTK